jgi:amidohydrolase
MDNLYSLRQFLHQNPELSGDEEATSAFIKKLLMEIGVKEFIEDFNSPSFIACIKGQKEKGNILYRCELDALPITEMNTFGYKSVNSGVSHKCGHDGHMTIIIGVAKELVERTSEFGNIYLFFQSAEETGRGAQELIDLGYLKKLNIDYAFALHNVPGYAKGTVICKTDLFTPHVESICIQMKGKESHASEPDKGLNPTQLIQLINTKIFSLHHPESSDNGYCVVAPIFIEMGERTYGTSAGKAEMGFTIRTLSTDSFEQKRKMLNKFLQELNHEYELEVTWEWLEPFYSTCNDHDATRYVQKATDKLQYKFLSRDKPFDWGEDFGLITQEVKGAMFGLGAGLKTPNLHNPNYDFPDEIIQNGINVFIKINELIQNDIQ